jgi:hypothetical protein
MSTFLFPTFIKKNYYDNAILSFQWQNRIIIIFQLLITHHQVYELIGSRWMDQGTAFCFGQFQEETNEALLIARSERNYHDIVLSTAIRSNDVYQRQQGE